MVLLYGFTVVHIRDRPCDFEQAVVCPCTERHMFKSHLQKIFPLFIQLAEFFYLASFEFSVKLNSFILVSFPLQLLYFCHTLPDRVCRFSDPSAAQALEIDWRDIRTKIQAVEKRLADPSLILRNLCRCTAAAVHIRIVSAGTGIHRRAQDKICRKLIRPIHSRDPDHLILQRLSQDLQAPSGKLRHLIQEKHARLTMKQLPNRKIQYGIYPPFTLYIVFSPNNYPLFNPRSLIS